MPASRVFIVHEPKRNNNGRTYNVTPALEFGQIEYIFEADFNPTLNVSKATEIARAKIATMTENDYIVWAGGDPLGLFLCGMLVAEVSDNLRWLFWDRKRDDDGVRTADGRYLPLDYQVFKDN